MTKGYTLSLRYPVLPMPEKVKSMPMATAIWLVVAAVIHAGVYAGAVYAAGCRVLPMRQPIERDAFVVIEQTIESEPLIEKPIEPEATVLNEPAAGVAPDEIQEKKVKKRKRKAIKPKEALREKKEHRSESNTAAETFRDIGNLGNLYQGALGPGGSSFAVGVGNGNIDGPIGRQSGIQGVRSSNSPQGNHAKVSSAKRQSQHVASIRSLSRRAKPKTAHNRKIKANYPQRLRKDAMTGDVNAVLIITPDGAVQSVRILKSPHPEFSMSAKKALLRFQFEPALDKHGKPVSSKVKLTYRFTLE